MDDTGTTFDERVAEVRKQRRHQQDRLGVEELPDLGQAPRHVNGRPGFEPDFDTLGSDDPDLEKLRRDISRLEGKVDALLAALEVEDGDRD
jgi:hypothetical protein